MVKYTLEPTERMKAGDRISKGLTHLHIIRAWTMANHGGSPTSPRTPPNLDTPEVNPPYPTSSSSLWDGFASSVGLKFACRRSCLSVQNFKSTKHSTFKPFLVNRSSLCHWLCKDKWRQDPNKAKTGQFWPTSFDILRRKPRLRCRWACQIFPWVVEIVCFFSREDHMFFILQKSCVSWFIELCVIYIFVPTSWTVASHRQAGVCILKNIVILKISLKSSVIDKWYHNGSTWQKI